jgi:hypothetical protein
MKLRALLTTILLCLAVNPAFAGFAIINGGGTGGAIGQSVSGSGATATSSASTVDIPPGSLVVQVAGMRANASFTTCSDSVGGNTWSVFAGNQQTGMSFYVCYSLTSVDLPIGTTFSFTSANTGVKSNIVAAFSGAAASPLDPTSAGGQSTTNTTSVSIGPSGAWQCPGVTNCNLQIAGFLALNSGTVTETSGFTSLGTTATETHMAYQITSATTATTYTSTLGTSSNYAGKLVGFDAAVGGGSGSTCTIAAAGGGVC